MIIGIGGLMCSGKTSVAKYISKNYQNVELVNFADKLKLIAEDLFGMTVKDRRLLQELGKQMRTIRDSVWIDYIFNKFIPTKNYVIGDVRYLNETQRIKDNGGFTIYIERPERFRLNEYEILYGRLPSNTELNDSSESLDKENFDFIIKNNSTKEDLFKQIDFKLLGAIKEKRSKKFYKRILKYTKGKLLWV